MTKKLKVKTTQVIEVQDWDELVSSTYGRPYNFQQQDGCQARGTVHLIVPEEADDFTNTTVPETVNHAQMGVSFASWLARDPKQELNAEEWKSPSAIEMWWDRNFYPNLQMVANDLHAKGLLPAGEYTIEIDW